MKGMGQTKIHTDNIQPSELAATPERSVVSLMVVDTVGSTELIADLDPDDAQNLLDRIYHYVREQVEDAGGLLVSFAGDGGVAAEAGGGQFGQRGCRGQSFCSVADS